MNPGAIYGKDGVNYEEFFLEQSWAQGSFQRMRKGGVKYLVASVGIETESIDTSGNPLPFSKPLFSGAEGIKRMFHLLGMFRHATMKHQKTAKIVSTATEAKKAVAEGKTAILLHLVGLYIDRDIGVLEALAAIGVRSAHPPFDGNDPSDALGLAPEGGLTKFGKETIRNMEKLGMIVDVSHATDKAFRDIATYATKPFYASHSNARALCNVKRNLTDAQIREIGRCNGYIGLHFSSGFIDETIKNLPGSIETGKKVQKRLTELRMQYQDPFEFLAHRYARETWKDIPGCGAGIRGTTPPASLSKLVDHISYMAEIAGIDCIGIGPDYDLSSIPREVDTSDRLSNLTAALLQRGFSRKETRKIMGGNFISYLSRTL